MRHNYLALSPSDFETLAVDILSALHSVHFERYGEGRDGGVDGKYVTSDGGVWIVQAKRYRDTKALLRQMGGNLILPVLSGHRVKLLSGLQRPWD